MTDLTPNIRILRAELRSIRNHSATPFNDATMCAALDALLNVAYPGTTYPAAPCAESVDGLLPCPFDGSPAWLIVAPDTQRPRAQCTRCGTSMGEFESGPEAIAAWNRRVALAETKAVDNG